MTRRRSSVELARTTPITIAIPDLFPGDSPFGFCRFAHFLLLSLHSFVFHGLRPWFTDQESSVVFLLAKSKSWRAAMASRDVSEFIFEMNSIGGV